MQYLVACDNASTELCQTVHLLLPYLIMLLAHPEPGARKLLACWSVYSAIHNLTEPAEESILGGDSKHIGCQHVQGNQADDASGAWAQDQPPLELLHSCCPYVSCSPLGKGVADQGMPASFAGLDSRQKLQPVDFLDRVTDWMSQLAYPAPLVLSERSSGREQCQTSSAGDYRPGVGGAQATDMNLQRPSRLS